MKEILILLPFLNLDCPQIWIDLYFHFVNQSEVNEFYSDIQQILFCQSFSSNLWSFFWKLTQTFPYEFISQSQRIIPFLNHRIQVWPLPFQQLHWYCDPFFIYLSSDGQYTPLKYSQIPISKHIVFLRNLGCKVSSMTHKKHSQ